MSWVHLIALGAGMGIYAVGSILFRAFTGKTKATGQRLPLNRDARPKLKVVSHDGTEREAFSAVSPPDLRQPPEKSDERTGTTPQSVAPDVDQEPPEEALLETPPKVRPELEAHEEPSQRPEVEASEESVPETAEISEGSPTPAKRERKKLWFLVKSSSGQVRVCQAWEATPKTIAGPFPTRDAATKAKASVSAS